MMSSHHRMEVKGRRFRSRDRVHPHAQVAQLPQIQPMVKKEPDTVSDKESAVVNPLPPSSGPPPSAEQRGRSRREQRSRSRERAPPQYLHMPAPSPNMLYLLPETSRSNLWLPKARMKIQQPWNHRVARSPQRKESSQKQVSQKQKGKNYCRNETAE